MSLGVEAGLGQSDIARDPSRVGLRQNELSLGSGTRQLARLGALLAEEPV